MNYQINTPWCILPEGCHAVPAAGEADTNDKLFIVTNDEKVKEALIGSLNDHLSRSKKLSPTAFNEILDDALTGIGQRNRSCDLAFVLFCPNGCLVAQMGRSRVLHVSSDSQEIGYDSRDQIQDYNAKARCELLRDIHAGDLIIATLADRVDGHKLSQVASQCSGDEEQLYSHLQHALSANRDEAPASYIIQLHQVKGHGLPGVSDINWKWCLLFLLLASAIAAVATLSLNSDLLHRFAASDDIPAVLEQPSADSVPTAPRDSLVPALSEPVDVAAPAASAPATVDAPRPDRSADNTPPPITTETPEATAPPTTTPQPTAPPATEPEPPAVPTTPEPEPAEGAIA